MEEDRLREWVREKLESGQSEERVKQSLENTGHDPSIVEEVSQEENPFEEEEKELEEHPFKDEDSGDTEDSGKEGLSFAERAESGEDQQKSKDKLEDGEDNVTKKEEKETESGNSVSKFTGGFGTRNKSEESLLEKARVDKDTQEEENDEDEKDKRFEFADNEDEKGDEKESYREKLPETPQLPRIPRKITAVLLILLVVSAGAYSLVPKDLVSGKNSLEDFSSSILSSETDEKECPDVGVLIRSLSSSEDVTSANVRVSRGEAEVVLEIFRNGQEVGETKKTVNGEAVMTVQAVGDRATFHPVGCERFISEKRY